MHFKLQQEHDGATSISLTLESLEPRCRSKVQSFRVLLENHPRCRSLVTSHVSPPSAEEGWLYGIISFVKICVC